MAQISVYIQNDGKFVFQFSWIFNNSLYPTIQPHHHGKKFLTLNLCLKTENVMLNHLIAWLIINYASCMPKLSVQYNFVKVSFVVKRIINIFWWILDSKTPFQYLFCLIVSQCQQLGSHHHQPVGQSNKPGVIIHWVQTRVVHRNIWNVSYKMFILRIYYYDRGVILKLLLC